ncbi:alkaline phosphatase, partial [Caulobacter sp. B11]|uniref:alkaline phosphatase D family protein n=1 Tax=Caulobacter sp. B11 TaxID=2048899 RepID=UPI00191BB749
MALPLLTPRDVFAATGTNPFTLGVASGTPRPDSVVLWTRLAVDPLRGGGMPRGRVEVRWTVWRDAERRHVFREGWASTSDADAHSIHVKLDGLEPGREYWYQFMFGDAQSTVGRTRTSSAADREAKLALASCNHWETGHFAAFADMAEWTPDCVIHIGDYIYEGGVGRLGVNTRQVGGRDVSFENRAPA